MNGNVLMCITLGKFDWNDSNIIRHLNLWHNCNAPVNKTHKILAYRIGVLFRPFYLPESDYLSQLGPIYNDVRREVL